MKTTFEVEVSNIKVGEKYYSFHYSITRDGVLVTSANYDSDHVHSGTAKEDFKKLLESSFAVETALGEYISKYY